MKEEGKGIYTAALAPASTPGSYGFEAVLDWDDSRTGHVRREERLEQFVAVKADPAKTGILTSRAADRSVLISVTPRDQYGNALGPGYESKVKAKLITSSGKLTGPIDRQLDGTYVFTITGVPAKEKPNVEITVEGVPVGEVKGVNP